MFLRFADRPSDSPYIEPVWRGRSDGSGPFVSAAAGHLELVVTRLAAVSVQDVVDRVVEVLSRAESLFTRRPTPRRRV
jgi:hypothetical protein